MLDPAGLLEEKSDFLGGFGRSFVGCHNLGLLPPPPLTAFLPKLFSGEPRSVSHLKYSVLLEESEAVRAAWWGLEFPFFFFFSFPSVGSAFSLAGGGGGGRLGSPQ